MEIETPLELEFPSMPVPILSLGLRPAAGGIKKVWEISYREVIDLGLKNRSVIV